MTKLRSLWGWVSMTGYFGDIDPPNSGRYVKERRVT